MKKLFLFSAAALCLLLPLFSFCQNSPAPVVDSSWIVNKAGQFYQANYKLFADGREATELKPYGDTATTANRFRENIQSVAATFANDAQIVSGYRSQVSELIRFAKTLPEIIGRNPLDTILKTQPNIFDNSGWTLSTGGTQIGIRFRQTAQGTFQWRADTTTNWRSAAFLGSIIRLNSLNGYTSDFFKDSKGRWKTINQQYTIKQPGDIAARMDSADLPEEALVPAPPQTELLTDGIVRIGEIQYKYNSKTKKWVVQK